MNPLIGLGSLICFFVGGLSIAWGICSLITKPPRGRRDTPEGGDGA
jgi:hypothetical protein